MSRQSCGAACWVFRALDTPGGRVYHPDMETTEYEAPQVTVAGTLESFTQANSTGSNTDAAYPAGYPIASETFS